MERGRRKEGLKGRKCENRKKRREGDRESVENMYGSEVRAMMSCSCY